MRRMLQGVLLKMELPHQKSDWLSMRQHLFVHVQFYVVDSSHFTHQRHVPDVCCHAST